MKAIVLAAGQGTRLRPLTDHQPKCMVPYAGKPMINHILDSMEACGIEDKLIIDGYCREIMEQHLSERKVRFCCNPQFETTNMVSTLFCAEQEFNDDLIISYGDIIYDPKIIKKLVDSEAPISVIVDKNWKELWQIRMENPLDDAETMKINEFGEITELGKKTTDESEIQGQYIGLFKFSKKILPEIINFYHRLDKDKTYDGKDFHNMYMTSFLQLIADHLMPLTAVTIEGGWMEIDSTEDLAAYQERNFKPFETT